MNGVDWTFLERQEGRRVLKGYVPQRSGEVIGKSGVTVATGVDIGQRTREQIATLDLPDALKSKLYPYAGLRREAALKALAEKPLSITEDEAKALDEQVIRKDVRLMAHYYNQRAIEAFDRIPWQVQTVLASLAINFGPALHVALPQTFAHACRGDWRAVQGRLENFPGKDPELDARRKREAELMSTLWDDMHLQ